MIFWLWFATFTVLTVAFFVELQVQILRREKVVSRVLVGFALVVVSGGVLFLLR